MILEGQTDPHAPDSLVCFTIGAFSYALDVTLVREVTKIASIYPVPSVPAPILGVISLRGATLALVDATQLLALPASTSSTALVIAGNQPPICALLIGRVIGVVRFDKALFTAARRDLDPPEVLGSLEDARGPLRVLDPSYLLHKLDELRFR